MANPISGALRIGTMGELLAQLRLLQYNIQAAPPLRDSGNDLIALCGPVIRTMQVKTTTGKVPPWPPHDRIYDLLAVIRLKGDDTELHLDASEIFLIPRVKVNGLRRSWRDLRPFALSSELVSRLFSA